MHRRRFLLAAGAAVLSPPCLRAAVAQPGSGLVSALERLPQMHALMIRRGGETIVAEARRTGGLDRAANIKSCSKSLVALLLGAAIERGEIAGVDARLGDVAPGLTFGTSFGREGSADTHRSTEVRLEPSPGLPIIVNVVVVLELLCDLARGDLHDADGAIDHVGGALLAFGALGHFSFCSALPNA